ncbi:ESX secretion-associated protein EspG [Actinomycetospora cinnamomea]|uniref:ESAT-6 protein secretion system EspG family protein n=1 Tax=Actinomycetospora cinnamomea TaxID=663609 RepID=A0A2U1FLK2_9PSEU|nr:ESX secretion-associated protein EspG [Actinomycetospora cinnamomea]PVZ13039.1 ESAT-6 protein secretion system EspG family protein [Actinomycetospora cinnamomea]
MTASTVLGGRFAGVRLDVGQYLALWRHLGLGERPATLHVHDHGATYAERDALDAAAWRRLGSQGLLDHRGAPHPALVDALAVLARPVREVDVVVQVPRTHPRAALAAARGGLGLVARRDAGLLLVEPADPHDLAGSLLARLPDARPAPGVPMALPADALFGRGSTLDERCRRLRRAGVPAHQVDRLRSLWVRTPDRAMTFGVSARDADGVARRAARTVTVLDTAAGRVAWGLDASGRRVLVHPLDRARLRQELAALLEDHVGDVTGSRAGA